MLIMCLCSYKMGAFTRELYHHTMLLGNTLLGKPRNAIYIMVMKRIEAFIASEKTPYVLSALENLGLQATFCESKGMGKGEKYTVSYGKGSGTQKMAYSTRTTVISIVDENKVKEFLLDWSPSGNKLSLHKD